MHGKQRLRKCITSIIFHCRQHTISSEASKPQAAGRQHPSPAKLEYTSIQGQEEDAFRRLVLKLQKTDGVTKNWKHIARSLSVNESELDSLGKSGAGGDIKELFFQMMRKWKQAEGKEATLERLEKALRDENLVAAAKVVRSHQKWL